MNENNHNSFTDISRIVPDQQIIRTELQFTTRNLILSTLAFFSHLLGFTNIATIILQHNFSTIIRIITLTLQIFFYFSIGFYINAFYSSIQITTANFIFGNGIGAFVFIQFLTIGLLPTKYNIETYTIPSFGSRFMFTTLILCFLLIGVLFAFGDPAHMQNNTSSAQIILFSAIGFCIIGSSFASVILTFAVHDTRRFQYFWHIYNIHTNGIHYSILLVIAIFLNLNL